MGTYAVSFELEANSTYNDRYESLMEQVRKNDVKTWDETTSFILVETSESLGAFADRIYLKSEISSLTDKLLVVDVTEQQGITRGKLDMPYTLKAIMPNVVQK